MIYVSFDHFLHSLLICLIFNKILLIQIQTRHSELPVLHHITMLSWCLLLCCLLSAQAQQVILITIIIIIRIIIIR